MRQSLIEFCIIAIPILLTMKIIVLCLSIQVPKLISLILYLDILLELALLITSPIKYDSSVKYLQMINLQIIAQFCCYYTNPYIDTIFLLIETFLITWFLAPIIQPEVSFGLRFTYQVFISVFVAAIFLFVCFWEVSHYNEVVHAKWKHDGF